MAKDSAKKAQVERGIVALLLGVLVLALFNGMRSMGALGGGGAVASAPKTEAVVVSGSLPEMVQHYREQAEQVLEEALQPSGSSVISESTAPPLYTAETLRDPMLSLLPRDPAESSASLAAEPVEVPRPPEPPDVTLEGRIWGGPRPQALIDGNLYQVGDRIREATIVSIDYEGVVVEVEGTPFRLAMREAARSPDSPHSGRISPRLPAHRAPRVSIRRNVSPMKITAPSRPVAGSRYPVGGP